MKAKWRKVVSSGAAFLYSTENRGSFIVLALILLKYRELSHTYRKSEVLNFCTIKYSTIDCHIYFIAKYILLFFEV
jgi:hypothetical protein